MRQILSISLPQKRVKQFKNQAKQRGFKNFSAYISHLISEDEHLISEKQILSALADGRKEYKAGKTIQVTSLDELL